MQRVVIWGGICAWAIALAPCSAVRGDEPSTDGWIALFDGKTLDGWKANEKPENWKVEEGEIVGRGSRSHLFYMQQEFANLEFKVEVKLSRRGNSGMYFRTEFGPAWPKGYEAQVNNSSPDPKRTGSLYNFVDVKKQLVPDDTWWTQHVIANGNHIIIKVNNEVVVDFTDEKNTHTKGYVALQQHDQTSVVHYKNLMVKPLP